VSRLRSTRTCDRIRAKISLELDGGLSQLERAMVASHIERCPDCRAYSDEVEAFTSLLRDAPLERPERVIILPRRRRRISQTTAQVGVAAAMAIAAFGVVGQLGEPESQRSDNALSGSPDLFASGLAPEAELAQVDAAPHGTKRPGPIPAV
jgi:anti-sigma factor RsiW